MASYYISPSGSNSSGTGSQSNPWATLDHAISRVTTAGDDIRVMAGNYPAISSQMELAQKVSIIGAGRDVTTITLTSTSGGGCIKMESYGQWTNKTIGFQSISGIKFVGSTTSGSPIGHIAISMYYRNHVYIHDCEFVDFVRSAVRFNGQQYWSGFNIDNPYYNGSTSDMLYIPFNNSFAEGNRFYNNIVHNCCGRIGTTNDFSGALEVSVCDGCLVYDNYMTATGRSGNDNGVPIKFIGAGSGFNRNSKIYNNHIIVGHMDTNYWQFAIEIWWDLGGTDIYNNTCEGAILSISFWFKTTYNGSEQFIIDHTDYDGAWKGYRVTIYNTGSLGLMLANGITGDLLDVSYSLGKDDGNWHHVLITFNGSNAYMYVDGVKNSGWSWAHTIAYVAAGDNLSLGNNTASSLPLNGELDEVGIWNRALTDSEAAELYNSGNGVSYPF